MNDHSALFSWRAAVVGSTLPPTCRHVALTLSMHMNDQGGSCFPSVDTLASETGLSDRAVQLSLSKLQESGWLAVVRGGGRGRSNQYAAQVPKPPETAKDVQGYSGDSPNDIHRTRFTDSVKGEPDDAKGRTTFTRGRHEDVTTLSRGERAAAPDARRLNGRAATPRKARGEDPPGFADCWESYPRKLNRKGAAKAYAARLKAGAIPDELMAATQRYARTAAGKQPDFVMHGSTFFGPNDRWRDYLAPPQAPAQPSGIGSAAHLPNGGRLTVVPNTPEERAAMGFPVGVSS